MKRLILLIAIITIAATSAWSVELNIDDFFVYNIMTHRNVTAVQVKGKELKQYKLSSFRSITVNNNAKLAKTALRYIVKDAKLASQKEEGTKSGRLLYGFYVFKSGNGKNRYLFFRLNNPDADVVTDITVVDMEGKATFDELKQMFK